MWEDGAGRIKNQTNGNGEGESRRYFNYGSLEYITPMSVDHFVRGETMSPEEMHVFSGGKVRPVHCPE